MHKPKPIAKFVLSKGTAASVQVQATMDTLTHNSTVTLRKEMSEAIKRDLKLLKKCGLISPS